ncbi:hypothetical protein L7F22_018471 [Adiantum nelumboides]|nr:hypothetical protein [Adiantum nelumboides]
MMSIIIRVLKHLTGICTTGHCKGCEAIPPALRDAFILEHFLPGGSASSQSGRAAPAEGALQDALLGDIGASESVAPSSTGTSRKRARVSQAEDEGASASVASTGARANFITPELAENMGIKTNEMGPAYTASLVAPRHEVAVTPLIGKFQLHIQGYVGHEEFFIMPLERCDVLLGMVSKLRRTSKQEKASEKAEMVSTIGKGGLKKEKKKSKKEKVLSEEEVAAKLQLLGDDDTEGDNGRTAGRMCAFTEVADDLIQGKPDKDGFRTRRKEPQGKQFSAKGNVTSRLTVPPFKKKPFAGSKPFARNRPFNPENRPNAENQRFRPSSFSGQRQGFKRHFTGKTIEERKALRDARKCYICEEEGHFANECPQRNSQNKDDKSDRKGKKPKPSAGLVPDLVGDQQNMDATELCRGHGEKLEIKKCWSSLIQELVPISFHQSWHPSWESVQRRWE